MPEHVFKDLPILETDRLILRRVALNDVDDMYHYGSDEEVAKYTSWYIHKNKEDTLVFIRYLLEKYNNQAIAPWGIEEKASGKFIGTIGFVSWDMKNSRAEIGYALSRNFWNRGLMSEAASKIIWFGFQEMGLVRIEARCHLENTGSSRVMEKVGMTFEGILRKHFYAKGIHEDVRMYAVIREEYIR